MPIKSRIKHKLLIYEILRIILERIKVSTYVVYIDRLILF